MGFIEQRISFNPILYLYQKRTLKGLKKTIKNTFKGQRGDISWLRNNGLIDNEYLFP